MKNTFINTDAFFEEVKDIYNAELRECGYNPQEHEDFVEEYAWNMVQNTSDNMTKYVHMSDTHMIGNFCDIRQDWDDCPEFINSEVKPWGDFDEVVKSVDEGTIDEKRFAQLQTWILDWFFKAFGTYDMRYNFISDFNEMEYREENEI